MLKADFDPDKINNIAEAAIPTIQAVGGFALTLLAGLGWIKAEAKVDAARAAGDTE